MAFLLVKASKKKSACVIKYWRKQHHIRIG